MTISNELRVGIMFLIGLILLVLLIVSLTRWGQERGTYTFTIRFKQAQGILNGAAVRIAGVEVGRVTGVSYDPGTAEALVEVRVSRQVQTYENYRYTIGVGGLVGERYIEITPREERPGSVVEPGSIVQGTQTPDMDRLLAQASDLFTRLSTTTDNLNTVLGDAQNQRNVRESLENLQLASKSAAAFTEGLNQTVARNQATVDLLVANLYDVSSDVRRVSASLSDQLEDSRVLENLEVASANAIRITERVDHLVRAADTLVSDPAIQRDLRETLATLRKTSTDLEAVFADAKTASAALPRITANVEQASEDLTEITRPFKEAAPDVARDVREIAASLRTSSATITGLAGQISSFGEILSTTRIQPEFRVMAADGGMKNTRSDVNIDVRSKWLMFRAGVTDVGNKEKLNLQMGNRFGNDHWLRYGVVQSKIGAGLDYRLSTDARLTAELFNPEDLRANALVDYRLRTLSPDWWLSAGVFDLFTPSRSFNVGVSYKPWQ